jgi:DNA polymerase elongation subunit (family B)
MMTAFIKKLHSLEPTFISGWNSDDFDIPYIYNRLKKIGLNPNDLSPFGFVNMQYGKDILGYVCIDLMWLYKLAASTPTDSARSRMLAALNPFSRNKMAALATITSFRDTLMSVFILAIAQI